jgi:hypothetical protein
MSIIANAADRSTVSITMCGLRPFRPSSTMMTAAYKSWDKEETLWPNQEPAASSCET